MTERGRGVLTRLGLVIPASGGFERMAAIAGTAERYGFDSVWVTDSAGEGITSSGGEPGFEAYSVLGALATRTRRANLGAMVSPITARNPAVLAKMVTGVDVVSGGRAVLGVGMGAPGGMIRGKDVATGPELSPPPPSDTGRPEPHKPQEPHGPHQSHEPHQRLDREARLESLAEGLHVCRAMFTEESPVFEGRYYRLDGAHNRPRPIRAGGIPILVGGGEDEGVLELVARYGDAVTVEGGLETVADRLDTLDRLCEQAGRDPAAISLIKTGRLVIAPTKKEATQRLDLVADREAWSVEDRAAALTGTPAALADRVTQLLEAGVGGVVFTMADANDLELVELAGTTMASLFGRVTGSAE